MRYGIPPGGLLGRYNLQSGFCQVSLFEAEAVKVSILGELNETGSAKFVICYTTLLHYNTDFNPILHTWYCGIGIVVLHVMVPQPYKFPPLVFKIGMVI
jgi:hypothetical protein